MFMNVIGFIQLHLKQATGIPRKIFQTKFILKRSSMCTKFYKDSINAKWLLHVQELVEVTIL